MTHALLVLVIVVAASFHAALILFLVAGGPLGIRFPRLVRLHVVTAIAVGAVFAVRAPCPLTVLEDWARARAGWPHGNGVGFVSRYLLHPLGLEQGPTTTIAIVLTWTIPTLIGHAFAWRQRRMPTAGSSRVRGHA